MGLLPSRSGVMNQFDLSVESACLLATSGDIVLVSDSSINASLINGICASRWSHVAIVYRDVSFNGGRPCIFESVKHKGRDLDLIDGKPATGVRILDLYDYLHTFKGNAVALRMLMTNKVCKVQTSLRTHITMVLRGLIEKYHGKPYESKWSEFVLARFPFIPRTSESPTEFFCSELVAWCYINIGLLSKKAPSSSYLPEEFSDISTLNLSIPPSLVTFYFPETVQIKLSEEMLIDTTPSCETL